MNQQKKHDPIETGKAQLRRKALELQKQKPAIKVPVKPKDTKEKDPALFNPDVRGNWLV